MIDQALVTAAVVVATAALAAFGRHDREIDQANAALRARSAQLRVPRTPLTLSDRVIPPGHHRRRTRERRRGGH